MRTLITALALIGLLAVSAYAADPLQRTITTSGDATIYAAPNEVTVSLGVEIFENTLEDAKTHNDEASQRLIKSIKAMGIDDKDIQVARMNVEIVYENRAQPVQGVQGYRTTRSYSVKLKDLNQFEQLIDTALKNGANRLLGFRFDSTDLPKLRDQARTQAIMAAKDRATLLAAQLNCQPGRPMTISEGPDSAINVNYISVLTPTARGGAGGGGGGFGGAAGAADAGDTLPMGQMAIRANVSVTFELLDGAGK
jgi:uncharacterized protein